jgi:hypothetical protein
MRIKHWKFTVVACTSLIMGGCSTTNKNPGQMATNLINRQSVTPITHQTYPAKNPETVALYTNQTAPHYAYRIIGVASVSKRNLLGMQRQDATVDTMMKKLAASIGGDGVIDINQTPTSMDAKVIAYQKILV